MKVLIIDNYDSFTFNLYQLTGEVLYEEFSNEINDIIVKRNDEVSLSEIEKKGTLASPATALAISVLPVPGGPTSNTPLGILPPNLCYLMGFF